MDFAPGLGTYTITDTGAGPLSITKTGAAIATIPVGATLTFQGATLVNGMLGRIADEVRPES